MGAISSARRPWVTASLPHASVGALLAAFGAGCGAENDAPDPEASAAASGVGGSGAVGLASFGGTGSATAAGGSGGNGGNTVAQAGAGSATSAGGKPPAVGGGVATGGSGARGGGPGSAGSPPAASAGGPAGPPAANDDGSSPYERECHGDTVMCEDVEALRCLGIRVDTTVYGYSCSNTCETDDDCSIAPSSGEAKAGCVDFVTQKHCLLLCLSGGTMRSCPEGMGCYVYPQSPVGYCLWQ